MSMKNELPDIISCYLKKETCDKLQKYTQKVKGFNFYGSITPHGHFDVKLKYEGEHMDKKEINQHFKNLLDIILEE